VTQAPTPVQTQTIDANAVGAPEPPAAPPVAAQPQPTAVPETAPAQEGDRLPGLPTPDPAAVAQAQPPAAAAPAQPPAEAQPAADQPQAQPAADQPQAQPTPIQPPAPEPTAQPAPAQPPAQPAAEEKPQDEAPAQQPVGTPTLEPIPPPPAQQADAAPPAVAQQPAPAPKPQQAAPAPKPQAPAAPPPAPASGGAFALSASASPVNPISEQAMVTISVRATQGGAPLAGATCMASIHYRTATAKQPNGGFRTNANGVGSFTLDARGTTYGYYIPVDVTCTGRGGTASARTGFTPVKGR
jgi:hypothetical protein